MLINDLSAKISAHRSSVETAVERVLNRSWFVLGPEVGNFESTFAAYIGVNYCCTLANGTDALELGFRALGIMHGDKVATVANAGFYTSTALLAIGAEALYLDVNLDTRVVSLSEIKRAIHQGVKAIVVTHLYGQAVKDITEISELCHSKGIALIEDCAQAHGAKIDGKQVGSFGDIGCFSFYPTKNLGALGDGGAVVTNNQALAEKVARLRQYGWSAKYQIELAGARNSRLDEMQAAILSEFLPLLDSWNHRRREIASQYSMQINHPEVILPLVGKEDYVGHLYVVRTKKRELLKGYLRSLNIATDIHYPIPDLRQPIFGDRFSNLYLPNTEQLAEEILTLPCYPEMTDADVQFVSNAVNNWNI